MKIESDKSVGASSGVRKGGNGAAAPGFSPSVEAPQRTAAVSQTAPLTALDAIIALQSDEPPARRRARQAKRGGDALDALERLEQGLVSGRAPAALKAELERLSHGAERTGENGLDDVLREIDTRLAVELAKLERVGRA